MKYAIILGDGMSDESIEELGWKTPLEYAKTPTLDSMAQTSDIGLVKTIPDGMSPGSDTANLSVLGYDPKKYYSGRSPLEALSIGVDMKDTDIALRCNFVTLSNEEIYDRKIIIDHSAGEISTEDAGILLEDVKKELTGERYYFYKGTSYRHLMIWDNGKLLTLTPPHDILGKVIAEYLPAEPVFREMMRKSYDILSTHPLNKEREAKGLCPANSIWFWGAGTKPSLSSFEEKNRKRGTMISAVDLLKGIAKGTGMTNIDVKGANGGLHTNYEGKAKAAIKALCKDGYDFVYIHVEAPDEMGHQGDVEKKIQAIEYLDERVIKLVKEGLEQEGCDFRIAVLPDHPTPVAVRTHTSDAVPYLLYDSRIQADGCGSYHEKNAKATGKYISEGHTFIDILLEN